MYLKKSPNFIIYHGLLLGVDRANLRNRYISFEMSKLSPR